MKSELIANQLFEQNIFQQHKYLEKKLDIIKDEIKRRLDEETKRLEYKELDVVVKFVAVKKYDFDILNLQELLYNHGLLIDCSQVITKAQDVLSKIKEFELEQTYHVRINLKHKVEINQDFSKLNDLELITLWKEDNSKYKELDRKIKQTKDVIMKELISKNVTKVVFNYGTINLCKNKTSYDMKSILDNFGFEFFNNYCGIKNEKLDEYISLGFLNKKEVEKFKKLSDITLRFVVMKISDENNLHEFLKNKYVSSF
jgi:3-polyprenyl-4-hydroxybenzoate decarboxylase and related decarboxylases